MILLDTHVVICLALEPDRLSKRAKEAIRAARIQGERPRCGLRRAAAPISPVLRPGLPYFARTQRVPSGLAAA
jgi:hypothetical protein